MNRIWQRFLLWLSGARAPQRAEINPVDAMCRDLASHYVDMGPYAAGSAAAPSPGSEQLLARARIDMRQQYERLVPAISRGIAASSSGSLALDAANETAARRATDVAEAQARSDAHARARPQVPRVLNRIASHRAFRTVIACACVLTEMVITTPSLEVLSHGKQILGIPLEDVLAFLLGLFTFLSAEVAAECFITWLQGRRVQRSRAASRRRWLRSRRSRRPRLRSATGRFERAAGVAAIVIVIVMVGLLSWFISVRDQNNRAAENIRNGAGTAATTVLPGLPLGNGAAGGAPAQGSAGAAPAGPIQGLGGAPGGGAGQPAAPAGPINLGGAPGSAADTFGTGGAKKPDTEGQLGPVGALSIVAFLVAFTAAALGGATEKYTTWRRRRRRLTKELAEARAAHEVAQRAAGGTSTRTPQASIEYDEAARVASLIVERNLARVTRSESRIRELYIVFCRRADVEPIALGFPPIPALPDELGRLLRPELLSGHQVGGVAFGMDEPDFTAPEATPGRAPDPPSEPPEGAAGDPPPPDATDGESQYEDEEPLPDPDVQPGPTRPRPSPEDVQSGVREATGDMRGTRESEPRRRRGPGRFLPNIRRRRGHGGSEEEAHVSS